MLVGLFTVWIPAVRATPPPTPVTNLTAPQGGKILYGTVDGATTQAAAMSKILGIVGKNCGEKPQIGRVFRFKGTKTVGVFFTVTNHPAGNVRVSGLVLSAASGPTQVEAALVSDEISRFGQSVNPMLQRLLSVWHPDGPPAASDNWAGAQPAQASVHPAGPAPLRMVSFPDGSAQVGVPDGWQLVPPCAGGTGGVQKATNNHDLEVVGLGMTRLASVPNPYQRQGYGGFANNTGTIVFPANVDLTRAFPAIFNQFWRLNNVPDTQLTVDHAEMVQAPPGQRCVHVTGHAKIFAQTYAKTPGELNALLCTTMPSPAAGSYLVILSYYALPVEFADRDRATAGAIMASFQPNQAVINRMSAQMAAPAIAAIHAIGRQAAERMKTAEENNETQHAGYWAQQDKNALRNSEWENGQINHARNDQGFDNYILDRSVIQVNDGYGNGGVGHATVSDNFADALVKTDPNRFEIVDTPNYWLGTDFHR